MNRLNKEQFKGVLGMVLVLYNTATRKKEPFIPLKRGEVSIYTCGPTVHDYAHIGNFRTFVFQDLLRRWLRYRGYRVKQVMNITDVDEKTIERAKRKRVELKEITSRYERAFFEDLARLNIERVEYYPRASEHIPEMVRIAKELLDRGYAFRSEDGTVYFDVNSFKDYGSLSGKRPVKKVRRRAKREDYTQPAHFALWIPGDERQPVAWETELGRGIPAWNCECSAMALKYLGEGIDIHSGGADLIFPHHENGKAICEALTGRQFTRYWLHCEHLLIEGKKMSKTLRNYFTLRDMLKRGYSPIAVRLLLLSRHYRRELNFTFEKLGEAEKRVKELKAFVVKLREAEGLKDRGRVQEELRRMKLAFENSMDDDLNVEEALRVFFNFVDTYREKEVGGKDAREILRTLGELDRVLGILATY